MAEVLSVCPLEYEHSPQCGVITILKVIDPFTYWIQCERCININKINDSLRSCVKSYRNCDFTPAKGELVIVQDIDSVFYRGCVVSLLREGFYRIKLLDANEEITVQESDIYLLPPQWKKIKEQAHQIGVYGILPNPEAVMLKWQKHLNEIMTDADKVNLEDSCQIMDKYFGSIVIEMGRHMVGLDELLLDRRFGLPSLDFEKDIETSWKLAEQVQQKIAINKPKSYQHQETENLLSAKKAYSDRGSSINPKSSISLSPQHIIFLKAFSRGLYFNVESLLSDKRPDLISERDFQNKDIKTKSSAGHKQNVLKPDICIKHDFHTDTSHEELNFDPQTTSQSFSDTSCSSSHFHSISDQSYSDLHHSSNMSENKSNKAHKMKKRSKSVNRIDERFIAHENLMRNENIRDPFPRSEQKMSEQSFVNADSYTKSIEHVPKPPYRKSLEAAANVNMREPLYHQFSDDSYVDRSGRREKHVKENQRNTGRYRSKSISRFTNDQDYSTHYSEDLPHFDKSLSSEAKHSTRYSSSFREDSYDYDARKGYHGRYSFESQTPIESNVHYRAESPQRDSSKNNRGRYTLECRVQNENNARYREDSPQRNSSKNYGRHSVESPILREKNARYREDSPQQNRSTNYHGRHSVDSQIPSENNYRYREDLPQKNSSSTHQGRYSLHHQLPTDETAHFKAALSPSDTPTDQKKSSSSVKKRSPVKSNHLICPNTQSIDNDKNQANMIESEIEAARCNALGLVQNFFGIGKKESEKQMQDETINHYIRNTFNKREDGNIPKGLGRGKLLKALTQSTTEIVSPLMPSGNTVSVRNYVNEPKKDKQFLRKDDPYAFSASDGESCSDVFKIVDSPTKPVKAPVEAFESPSDEDELQHVSKANFVVKESLSKNTKPSYISNDHEDRYYEIENRKYLSYPLDEQSLNAKDSSNKDSTVPESEVVYEKLLNEENENDPANTERLNYYESKGLKLEKEILSEYTVAHMTEKMKLSCGILHGNIKCQPVSTFSELNFHQHIFANMVAKKMNDLTRSQMYALPALLQRRNLILIGPPNSGKTLAYVMSVFSLLLNLDYYKGLKGGNGPRCVIVASSSQRANSISQFCSAMSGARMTIITTHGGGLEFERKVELTNGCEILVTTPRCWLRLLKHPLTTNMFRLCHLIFDDAHILLDTFLPEVKEIFTLTMKMLHLRKQMCQLDVQVVLVGEKWTPVVEDCLNVLKDPVLCITTHVEATLYARVKPKMYILSPQAKIEKLKELVESSKKMRTIIICKSAKDVKNLRPVLFLLTNNLIIAHENMSVTMICDASNSWVRSPTPPIFICSDPILGEVAVTNAQCLIHFSLPDNKSYFSERFSTIKDHFYDRIKHPESSPPDCRVHILVDSDNEQQFPEIVSFMERLSTPIPQEVLDVVKKLTKQKEEMKQGVMLCERMLMFGNCWKIEKCWKRHIFNKDTDTPKFLPQSGMVKLKLLHIHNPSHYSVRILATKSNEENDQWADIKTDFVLIGMKMSNYYSCRENRVPHGRVNVGDMVAVEVEPDILFKRAVVTDIVLRDEKLNPVLVAVHLIDEGSVFTLKVSNLLYLPSDLKVFKQESYDLFLTSLQPVDVDNEWSFASLLRLRGKIKELALSEEDSFFAAKIILSVGNSMIVSALVCCEWLEMNKCHIVRFSPKKFILESKLAENNPDHIPVLMDMALDSGIISSYPSVMKEDEDNIEEDSEIIQWAHLETDKYTVTYAISTVDPSLFYLKISNFSDRLDALHKDLSDQLNRKPLKPSTLREDMVCAVRHPDDQTMWNRGLVKEVLNDSSVEVFCVDFGDIITVPVSHISVLPKGFITRLPFQAIECSLIGISPFDDGWLIEAVKFFHSLTSNEDGTLKAIYATVCDSKPKAETTGGRHYLVMLIDTTGSEDVVLNKEFVYKGYANWDISTKHHLTATPSLTQAIAAESEQLLSKAEKDEGSSDKEVWTPEVCENAKENLPDDNPNSDKSNDSNKTSVADIIKYIQEGDFDFEFTKESLVLQTFFPTVEKATDLPGLPDLIDKLPNIRALPSSEDNKTENDNAFSELQSNEESDKVEDLKNHSFDIEDDCDKESTCSDNSTVTFLKSVGFYHPKLFWSQTDYLIRIRIELPDVVEYSLEYSAYQLEFVARLNEKHYFFNIDFFGPVCSDTIVYSPKGLHFEIKVDKYVKGVSWPRLTYRDVQHSWIKLDLESVLSEDNDVLESLMKRGKAIQYATKIPSDALYPALPCGPDMESDSEVDGRSDSSDGAGEHEYYDLREVDELVRLS